MENNEENTVTARLKRYIELCGLSNSQFADKAGIPRPTLSQLIHGRNKSVNDLLLRKLHENFPDLNISWLLFGVGNISEKSNIQFSDAQTNLKSASSELLNNDIQDNNNLFSDTSTSSSDGIKEIFNQENSGFGVLNAFSNSYPASQNENDMHNIVPPLPGKKIKSIIVLYTDSSFEVFSPDKSEI